MKNDKKQQLTNLMETTNTSTYLTSLVQAGLTYSQAEVYEILIKNGSLKASKIHQKSDLKRSLVYKVLGELLEMGLVTKDEPKKVAIFTPQHPAKLKDLAEKAEDKAKTAQIVLGGILGQMSSDFNLTLGKPGVQFYEGKEGLIKIYETLLAQKQNIDSIEDKGEMAEFLGNYTKIFTKKRAQNKIFNRVIAPSNNPINKNSQAEFRETHFIPVELFPFRIDIKITGNFLSLITFQKNTPIGVLIENKEIADNFKILFNTFWKLTDQKNRTLLKHEEASSNFA